MAILGAALRGELAEALGVTELRKELRADLRGLARELKAIRAQLKAASVRGARATSIEAPSTPETISAEQIRAARQHLGASRKAFAARVRVSPSIVYAWETGRSAPRRAAVVARLRQVVTSAAIAAGTRVSKVSSARKAPDVKRRVLKLSPKRRATLKLQGRYMGYIRSLGPRHKAKVKKVKAASGFPAAIRLAETLRRR
jgi:DNA-binding transcriptional regulator YiaG